ncbi:MAG TPA: AsmA-like C-terminal region-containing protein [Candidatus Omnitrophota bacterium]|nr:AsmA-like C-terminal region-containing protein [Candidatus Omnitrophota bacterium]
MLKAFQWILITLVVLILLAAAGLYFFIKNFDINRYNVQITSEISKAIHRPVTIGRIQLELSLEKGLNLRINGLSILDEPPSQETLISVDNAYLGVDIRAFVFSNELIVSHIELHRPYVHMVQYAEGANNLTDLAVAAVAAKPQAAPVTDARATGKKEMSFEAFDPNKMRIKRIHVVDGTFSFNDTSGEPPLTVGINNIDLVIEDFFLMRPFDFQLKFNVFSRRENVFVKGKAVVDQVSGAVQLSDLTVQSALSDIDFQAVQSQFSIIEPLGIEDNLKGDLRANVRQMALSAQGITDYDFEAWLTDGKVKIKALTYPIENIDIHLLGRRPQLIIKDLFMYVGAGKITAQATVDQFLSDNKLKGNVIMEDIRLEEIIPQQQLEYTLVGKLQGNAEISLEHNELNSFLKTLSAEERLEVKEAKIINFNVLKAVLDKLSAIPPFAEGLQQRLPEKYKEKLNQKDTVFEAVEIKSKVQGEQIFIQDILVKAEGFEINARGKMDLAQNLFLEINFYLPADLASAMLSSSADLTFLLQPDGRLRIPFKAYHGPLTKFKVYPDIEYMAKEAIQQKGKEELKKAIFKALDIEEAQPTQQPEGAPQEPSPQDTPQDVPPERILIENVLDAIFK